MLDWFKEISKGEKRMFWACFGGWALDALNVQMFSLVIPTTIMVWYIGKAEAGLMSGVTLAVSALGGWIIGALTDRFGRVHTLQIMVLWFPLATFALAFAQNFEQFLVLKAIQGFGFGGEWVAGAVLMAEGIRANHRGKAMGTMQSVWVVGWGVAVLLYALTYPLIGPDLAWRVVFAAGLLSVLLIIYTHRGVKEPVPTVKPDADANAMPISRFPLLDILRPQVLYMTLIGGLLGVGAHGGYYALMTWLSTYFKTERHLPVLGTGGYLAMTIFAFWCGCVASTWLLDVFGCRGNILLFSCCHVVTALVYLLVLLSDGAILVLGSPLGFFAVGVLANMGALFNELYPQGIRGTGMGSCCNLGYMISATFPVLVGKMNASMSLGMAIGIDVATAYSIVAVAVPMPPEMKGRDLAAVTV